MAEYIEREAFKAEIRRLSTHYLNEWDTLGVLAAADRIPAVDVVARDCYDRLLAENDELRKERPVVRCKDCEYWDATQEAPLSEGCFLCTLEGGYPKGDFYCALGERRMDGDGE